MKTNMAASHYTYYRYYTYYSYYTCYAYYRYYTYYNLLLFLCLEARHGTGVSGHFMGSYMNY